MIINGHVECISSYSPKSTDHKQTQEMTYSTADTTVNETEELIIGLSSGTSVDMLRTFEITVKRDMKINGRQVALVVKPNSAVLEKLRKLPEVRYIEENLQRRAASTMCPWTCSGDTFNWGIIRSSYNNLPDYATDPYLYDNLADDATIYILDTGVDIDHPEFGGRAKYGMVSDELADEGPSDGHGHGSNVASLAAGATYGAAKNATIVSCKVLSNKGSGSVYGISQGISWVTNNVAEQQQMGKVTRAVINMSFGGSGTSQTENEAIIEAVQHRIVIVAAAGNDAYDSSAHFQGAFDTVIAVAAIDSTDAFASFSNYGPDVDISVAGVNCMGAGSSYTAFCDGDSDCLSCYSGTSQATPHVSGVVSQWLTC